MKSEYLIVLLLIALFPVVLSADKRLGIYRYKRAMFATMMAVCFPYWLWDIAATSRGHWSFNPDFTLGPIILGMPLEEWMFFVVIVFVSIFTWEASKYFLRQRP